MGDGTSASVEEPQKKREPNKEIPWLGFAMRVWAHPITRTFIVVGTLWTAFTVSAVTRIGAELYPILNVSQLIASLHLYIGIFSITVVAISVIMVLIYRAYIEGNTVSYSGSRLFVFTSILCSALIAYNALSSVYSYFANSSFKDFDSDRLTVITIIILISFAIFKIVTIGQRIYSIYLMSLLLIFGISILCGRVSFDLYATYAPKVLVRLDKGEPMTMTLVQANDQGVVAFIPGRYHARFFTWSNIRSMEPEADQMPEITASNR